MRSSDDNNNDDIFTGRSEGRPRGGGNRHSDGGGSDRAGGGGDGRTEETPGAAGGGLGHRSSTSSARKRSREGAAGAATAAAVEASGGSPIPAARGGRSPGGGFARGGGTHGAPPSLRASNTGVSAAAPLGYDHGPTPDGGADGAALASFAASLLAAGRERDVAWARDREELALRAALMGRSGGGLLPPSLSSTTSSLSSSAAASLSAVAALDVPTQRLLLLSQLPNPGSGSSAYSFASATSQQQQQQQQQQPRNALQEYVEAQAHLLLLLHTRHNSLLLPNLPTQREWGLVDWLRAQQRAAAMQQRDTAAVAAAFSSSTSSAAWDPYPWALRDPRLQERRPPPPSTGMASLTSEEQKEAMTGGRPAWPSAGSPFRRLTDDPGSSPPPAGPPPPQSAAATATATGKPTVPSPPIPMSQPQPNVQCRFHPRAINVSLSTDSESTSKFQALLRDQLLYVEAVPLDVQASTQGRNRPIRAGQVGIMCRHCRNIPPRNRPRGAIYFPHKLLSIYQSAQNMANHHYHPASGCPNAPDDINASLRLARADKSIVYGGGQQYWARAASESGLVETEGGLAFSFAAPAATTTTASTAMMTASSPAAA